MMMDTLRPTHVKPRERVKCGVTKYETQTSTRTGTTDFRYTWYQVLVISKRPSAYAAGKEFYLPQQPCLHPPYDLSFYFHVER